jgi:predicted DNA-binding transcriptional regulator AlpA
MSIEVINISIDQLNALLDEKVEKIISAISQKNNAPHTDQWFDLNGLIQYLPSHPKPQTIYEWVHKGIIPYYKSPDTKMLSFLKSEIDDWIKTGRKKTQSEKSALVNNYLNNKNNGSKIKSW